ncbi:LytR/AlgR family response regulator transcription factor [Thomasclavelia sp.]
MIIALIDSNNEELEITNSLIKNEIQKYTSNFIIEKINNPLTLDFNKYYDVLFLEIEMSKDGIELAKEYLKYHKTTKIIFISNNIERVFDTFDVHPFYFIKKKYLKSIISKVVNSLINKIGINSSCISVKTDIGLIDIPLNNIKYIKSDKHYCTFFTTNIIYKARDTIDNIVSKIVNKNFSRIHRSIIINWHYVNEFKYNTIKIDQDYLSVSRTYLLECKDSYQTFIKNKS